MSTESANPNGANGVLYGGDGKLLWKQFASILLCSCWAMIFSCIILYFVEITIGLRVSELIELTGLDDGEFGESIVAGHVLVNSNVAMSAADSLHSSDGANELDGTDLNSVVHPSVNDIDAYRRAIEMVPTLNRRKASDGDISIVQIR